MEWAPHVTVAAVIERENRFLLVEERVDGRAVYNQPAGHLEDGESLADAVRREVREETGHAFEPAALVGIYLWRHPVNRDTFLRVTFHGHVQGDAQPEDDAIIAVHWLDRTRLLDDTVPVRSPLVLRSIDDYLAGQRYPLTVLATL